MSLSDGWTTKQNMHFSLQDGPIQAQVCIATMVSFGMVMYTTWPTKCDPG